MNWTPSQSQMEKVSKRSRTQKTTSSTSSSQLPPQPTFAPQIPVTFTSGPYYNSMKQSAPNFLQHSNDNFNQWMQQQELLQQSLMHQSYNDPTGSGSYAPPPVPESYYTHTLPMPRKTEPSTSSTPTTSKRVNKPTFIAAPSTQPPAPTFASVPIAIPAPLLQYPMPPPQVPRYALMLRASNSQSRSASPNSCSLTESSMTSSPSTSTSRSQGSSQDIANLLRYANSRSSSVEPQISTSRSQEDIAYLHRYANSRSSTGEPQISTSRSLESSQDIANLHRYANSRSSSGEPQISVCSRTISPSVSSSPSLSLRTLNKMSGGGEGLVVDASLSSKIQDMTRAVEQLMESQKNAKQIMVGSLDREVPVMVHAKSHESLQKRANAKEEKHSKSTSALIDPGKKPALNVHSSSSSLVDEYKASSVRGILPRIKAVWPFSNNNSTSSTSTKQLDRSGVVVPVSRSQQFRRRVFGSFKNGGGKTKGSAEVDESVSSLQSPSSLSRKFLDSPKSISRLSSIHSRSKSFLLSSSRSLSTRLSTSRSFTRSRSSSAKDFWMGSWRSTYPKHSDISRSRSVSKQSVAASLEDTVEADILEADILNISVPSVFHPNNFAPEKTSLKKLDERDDGDDADEGEGDSGDGMDMDGDFQRSMPLTPPSVIPVTAPAPVAFSPAPLAAAHPVFADVRVQNVQQGKSSFRRRAQQWVGNHQDL